MKNSFFQFHLKSRNFQPLEPPFHAVSFEIHTSRPLKRKGKKRNKFIKGNNYTSITTTTTTLHRLYLRTNGLEKVRSSSFRSPFSHCTNFVNVRSIGGGASSLWMEKDEKREAVETGRRVPDAQRPRREGRGEAGLTLNSESAGVDPAATASATLLPRFRLPGAAPPSTNPLCVALACA